MATGPVALRIVKNVGQTRNCFVVGSLISRRDCERLAATCSIEFIQLKLDMRLHQEEHDDGRIDAHETGQQAQYHDHHSHEKLKHDGHEHFATHAVYKI